MINLQFLRHIKRQICSVVHILNPVKDVTFFEQYIRVASKTIGPNGNIGPIVAITAIFLFGITQTIYLRQTWFPLTEFERYIYADLVHFIFSPLMSAIIISFSLFGCYMYWHAYRRISPKMLQLIASIVTDFTRRNHCSTIAGQNINTFINAKIVQKRRERFARRIIQFIQTFCFVLDILLALIWLQFLPLVIKYRFRLFSIHSNPYGLLQFAAHLGNVTHVCIGFYAYGYICIMLVLIGTMWTYDLLGGFAQICVTLRTILRSKYAGTGRGWIAIKRLMREHIRLMRLAFSQDHFFAVPFLGFVLCSGPTNAFMVMNWIIGSGLRNRVEYFFTVNLIAYQFWVTVFLHVFIAQITAKIHAPAKPLLAIAATRGLNSRDFRAKFCVTQAIWRLHVRRKYGFHYGPMGLVTLKSFFQCIFVYAELLMFAYKWIKNIS